MAIDVAFRADGNSKIGFGHLMRTQALARQLEKRGAKVIFLTRNPENLGNFKAIGIDGSFSLNKEDELIRRFVTDNMVDMLIADSYGFNQERLDRIGQMNPVSVYIDDMNRHEFNVDFVINGNLYAPLLHYWGKAHFLLGSRYLLMREQFQDVPCRLVNDKVKDVLLTFGAADMENITSGAVQMIKRYHRFMDLRWQVVIGPVFQHGSEIRALTANLSNVLLYYNPDIKNLMENCDICISAAGSTIYELAACGVPSILMVAADNQVMLAEEAERQGVSVNLGWYNQIKAQHLYQAMDRLIDDYENRRIMVVKGQSAMDGQGTKRVADILLDAVGRRDYERDDKG